MRRSIGDLRGCSNGGGSVVAPEGGFNASRYRRLLAVRGPAVHKIFGGLGTSRIPSVNGLITRRPRPGAVQAIPCSKLWASGRLSPMTPVGLLSQSSPHTVVVEPDESVPRSEESAVPARADGLIYPCARCGSIVRAQTALRVDDLPYVGWTPCRVATYVNWCGHVQAAIPWPQANGSVRLIPVLRRGDLMPGVYVDLRDFVAQHRLCGRPTGDADPLQNHGYRVWAWCPCGARFERWVAADKAEVGLLRSALDDSRCSAASRP